VAHRSLAKFGAVLVALLMSTAPATVDGPAGLRPDGRPDLQGVWDFRTLTPMERPKELAGQEVLTDEEAAEFERVNRRNQDIRDATPRAPVNGTPTTADVERAYNDFWWDFGTKVVSTKRTSLIVDPPDGRIPPLTADAQRRAEIRAARRQRLAVGPEDRGVGERCILGFNSGPPMTPSAYNNNVQIFQTRDHVVLLNEMVHNARIIPVDGRPHLPTGIPQWVGDSRGRWVGDTLVVETKNFKGETAFPGSSAALHLTERFTRIDANTLVYEFTVEDPTTWTRPWTAQIPMTRADGIIYEYACHEGNYGLANLLSAARALERSGAGR
jgi:hypothetical protein